MRRNAKGQFEKRKVSYEPPNNDWPFMVAIVAVLVIYAAILLLPVIRRIAGG